MYTIYTALCIENKQLIAYFLNSKLYRKYTARIINK